ncbi:Alpha-aminoadipic semialdehyde synthase-like protein [Drosera capensis]
MSRKNGAELSLVDCQCYSSEVGADDRAVLDQIIDSLTSLANKKGNQGSATSVMNEIVVHVGLVHENGTENGVEARRKAAVLILGAGRVCRPAAELLASVTSISSWEWSQTSDQVESDEANEVEVIVASLFLKDAEEVIQGIPNARAIQLDVSDVGSLHKHVSEVDVVISLLPASCHSSVANACIELGKHLVTASYVDDSLLKLDENAKSAGVTILGEMGLDPGIDHMMAMKMINQAHSQGGKVWSFTSYCGGLPSPAAANNPLGYKFSWNPAGAIRAGRNPATFRSEGIEIHVSGDKLYDSATKIKLPGFPAFALECLPNRDSLVYGKLYGIMNEASTIFRGTLRFSKIMGAMAKLGFFDEEPHPVLGTPDKPTYETFTMKFLGIHTETSITIPEMDVAERIHAEGACQDQEIAIQTARTIIFLGLLERASIPSSCQSAFDVTCRRMEEKLVYSSTEQDMVLLHHEIQVDFPESRSTEKHVATLLEFGKTVKGRTTSAMALTVGVPAAVGALLLLANKIKKRGILRPTEPEVYNPALEMIKAYGIKLHEKIE